MLPIPTTAYFTSTALHFIIIAAVPVFVLISCSSKKKKKKKKNDAITMKLDLPTIKNEEPRDVYISKTTNKISGIGPEDPDLDSARLKIMKTQEDGNQQQEVPAPPAVKHSGTANASEDIKNAEPITSINNEAAEVTGTNPKSTRLSKLQQKMREQKRETKTAMQQNRSTSKRPVKMTRPGVCVAAATQHLESQQSMPRLRPPVHHSSIRQQQNNIDTDSLSATPQDAADEDDESMRV